MFKRPKKRIDILGGGCRYRSQAPVIVTYIKHRCLRTGMHVLGSGDKHTKMFADI